MKGNSEAPDQDPVLRYKESIESLNIVMNDVKKKNQEKTEQFIIFDCSRLKVSLLEYGTDFIQQIFTHLIKESKDELYALLNEFSNTIENLNNPVHDIEYLKKRQYILVETRAKLPVLEAKREPIVKKFRYI